MSDPLSNLTPARIQERSEAAEQIAQCLIALREPAWIDVIADWLGRYDGLEGYLWPEDDPLVQVRNLLNRYIETGQPLEPERFAGSLADLRFCYCAARHDEGGARWDPLRDDAFSAWTRGRIVKAWDTAEPWPSRDLLQTWLLIRFCRARTLAG